jgi:peptidoglycan/xylan/chitin deacetylase (PgdA/CDA1 family)
MRKIIKGLSLLTLLCILMIGFDSFILIGEADTPIVVLMYHHLLEQKDAGNNPAVVTVENFKDQMQYLKDHHYQIIPLEMLNNHIKNNKRIPEKSVVLTFDDGYQSVYHYAYPILKEYGYKASVFMITSKIPDKAQPFSPHKLTYMSSEEMNKSQDIFEFACHTHNLHILNENKKSLLVEADKQEIIKDLKASKEFVQTKYFAYPYGQYNDLVVNTLQEDGVELAFTVNPGKVNKKSNKMHLNRIPIYNCTTMEQFKKYLLGH